MELLAPAPQQTYAARNASYASDANSLIYGVTSGRDLEDLLGMGCQPLAVNPSANFRNLIDGGDFTVNPWQRGTAFTAIANTPTYTADRFFAVGGASSSISVSAQPSSAVQGFSQALQFGRASGNANSAPIVLGQILETADSIRCQGRYVTFSFWAQAGANYSGGPLAVAVQSGTGSNQSAASLTAGSWTGQAYPALTPNQSGGQAGAAGVFGSGAPGQQTISAAWQRYSFTALVPANATQLAVSVGYTPAGTAGAADNVQFMGFQFEIASVASPFEHRDVQVELEIAQRYAWVIPEPAANIVVASGYNTGSAAQLFYTALPVQMRSAPTIGFVTAGAAWKVHTNGAPIAASPASGGSTPTAISLTTAASGTTGQGCVLVGGGGTGQIVVSADF